MIQSMNKEKHVKRAFLWNMIGSTCYSAASFLYLLVVTRLCGVEQAGFFSLSYATAQMILQLGRYGMRTYQATDLDQRYTFKEYGVSRIISCAAMMLIGIVYSAVSFNGTYIIISTFVIFMKMVDAVEDVYHGNFQQKFNVELMGKLLALRNIYSAVVFIVTLAMFRKLYFSTVFTALTSFALAILVNGFFTRRYKEQESGRTFRMSAVLELLKNCAPLFVGTFLSLLLYNIPKYAMTGNMTYDFQCYYSILFMPSFVITLMCDYVFKPTITSIARVWWENNMGKFKAYILKILGLIALADVAIVLGGHFIGRRLLELVYGVDLGDFKLDFIVLLIGGGFSALVYMLYNILIAIRKEKCIIVVYAITTVITWLPAAWMVRQWGVMGACLNYLLSSSVLFILFGCILVSIVKKGYNGPTDMENKGE